MVNPLPIVRSDKYNPQQSKNTKSRKSLNLNISYGSFKKVNSKEPVYVPNHDQKMQIINTFFGSVSTNNNFNKIYENINTIPSYAEGGRISTPQIVMAAETGPERIIPERELKTDKITKINQMQNTATQPIENLPQLTGLGNSTLGPIYSLPSSINILMNRFSIQNNKPFQYGDLPKFDGYFEK